MHWVHRISNWLNQRFNVESIRKWSTEHHFFCPHHFYQHEVSRHHCLEEVRSHHHYALFSNLIISYRVILYHIKSYPILWYHIILTKSYAKLVIYYHLMGTPISSSSRSTYAWQFAGKSLKSLMFETSSVQPGITSNSTFMSEYSFNDDGIPFTSFPSSMYLRPILTSGNPLKTSSLVRLISVNPSKRERERSRERERMKQRKS